MEAFSVVVLKIIAIMVFTFFYSHSHSIFPLYALLVIFAETFKWDKGTIFYAFILGSAVHLLRTVLIVAGQRVKEKEKDSPEKKQENPID